MSGLALATYGVRSQPRLHETLSQKHQQNLWTIWTTQNCYFTSDGCLWESITGDKISIWTINWQIHLWGRFWSPHCNELFRQQSTAQGAFLRAGNSHGYGIKVINTLLCFLTPHVWRQLSTKTLQEPRGPSLCGDVGRGFYFSFLETAVKLSVPVPSCNPSPGKAKRGRQRQAGRLPLVWES